MYSVVGLIIGRLTAANYREDAHRSLTLLHFLTHFVPCIYRGIGNQETSAK